MEFSDLSIEIGHFYMSELQKALDADRTESDVRDYIGRRMDAGFAAVAPMIRKYEQHQKQVSVVILIDDYFWAKKYELQKEDIAAVVVEHSAERSIPLDFVVFESALAESVERMFNRIAPFPIGGDGSRLVDREDRSRWLSNGQAGRQLASGSSSPRIGMSRSVDRPDEPLVEKPRPHSLHIDIEMYAADEEGERKWACPVLAAWWQLIRLGMLRDSEGNACRPSETIPIGNERELFAKRTLTALAPDFLEIEAAVRTILSQVSVPQLWLDQLRDGRRMPEPDEHLSRIGYVFLSDSFHPHGLSGSDSWT